jgi:DnaJ-class molecular chaperone
MEYNDLRAALKIFDISGAENLKTLKRKHKELVKKFHPDTGCHDNEKIRQINAAYKILSEYCSMYKFTFSHDEFMQQYPEERLRTQFGDDPWGGIKKDNIHL